ncbi:hypothetical protein E8E11_005906 [Didymella keratinophila]|nr:hypothetical protein E8E11_005906 [Didymella keratinophila]
MQFTTIAALMGFGNRVLSQNIDLDFVKVVRPDPPAIKVPADRLSQPIVYDQAKAVANVIEDMRNNPLAESRKGSVEVSDSVQKRQEGSPGVIDLFDSEPACTDLNGTLYGDDASDSEEERVRKFLGNTSLYREALDAFTPENYTLVFQNMTNSTIQANGYLGYYVLSSYNTSECAQRCTDTIGCQAFNVYFERDPSLVPGPDCQNPPALLTTKCALWGGPISAGNALNAGQYRQLFHVVMSGSNGYVLSSTIGPLSTFAINAPLDCNGADTYMGFRLFNTSLPFSEELCAAACEETTRNAMAPRLSNSTTPPQICAFYNTYILEKNSITQGQICAMYSQSWDPREYATNGGQYDGEGNHFTIASSVFSGNVSLPPICPADLPDLRLDTEVSDFCTSYLPYNGPPTVTATVTSASATFSSRGMPDALSLNVGSLLPKLLSILRK